MKQGAGTPLGQRSSRAAATKSLEVEPLPPVTSNSSSGGGSGWLSPVVSRLAKPTKTECSTAHLMDALAVPTGCFLEDVMVQSVSGYMVVQPVARACASAVAGGAPASVNQRNLPLQ
jgi:hypothetical protein